jgi:hypothetical protein
MTDNTTIDTQAALTMGFTANVIGTQQEEVIEATELKFRTDMFIKDLVAKVAEFSKLEARTDAFLYELLQACYDTYVVISNPSSNIASVACEQLDKYCSKNGITGGKDIKLLSKFMNSVFKGLDRSKISTYSYVIKYGIKNNVANGALAAEIKRTGGIQAIKKASFKDIAAKTKAKVEDNLQQAQTKVSQSSMGVVDIPNAIGAVSKLKSGEQVVLIATVNAERKFVIQAATSDATVIKSAVLAAAKPKETKEKAQEAESADDAVITADQAELEAA